MKTAPADTNERRVLVVDDDADFAKSLKLVLESQHYLTVIARNQNQALEQTEKFNPLVVLCDIRLGTENGLDVITALQEQRPKLLCLVITAYASMDSALQALHSGVYDYLRKPINPHDLFATLNRCFETIRLREERLKAERDMARQQEELRALLHRLQTVRDEESARIAREVHDQLGQDLVALQMDLSLIEQALAGTAPDTASALKKIQSMKTQVLATLKKVETIATELRPEILEVLGLGKAIEWQAQEFRNRTGIDYILQMDEKALLHGKKANAIFRVMQEGLSNVVRHARASNIRITLKREADSAVFMIEDNGRGIREGESGDIQSLGLLGIRERIRMLGGTTDIRGSRGKGTVLTIQLPLHENSHDN